MVLGLSGCTRIHHGTKIGSNTIKVDTHKSRIADIRQVTVYQKNGSYLVKGNVVRNIHGRSRIAGHVDLELLNAQGNVVYKTSTRYKHSGLRFNKEMFYLTISKPIEEGSRLRITHSDRTMHEE